MKTNSQTEKVEGDDQKVFCSSPSDSFPADVRLRPLLGTFRTSGAIPSGLLATHLGQTENYFRTISTTVLLSAEVSGREIRAAVSLFSNSQGWPSTLTEDAAIPSRTIE